MGTQSNHPGLSKVGLLFSATAGLWMSIAPIAGHMGWPWPCAIAGLGVLGSLVMLWRRPDQKRGWAALIVLLSTTLLLVGRSGIPPAMLGIAGGVFILEWSGGRGPEE